jgi:hypothetical protein
MIRAGVRADTMIGVTKFSDANLSRIAFRLPEETRRTFRREISLELAAPDHTVPYGTVFSRDAFPGTSCLATIGVVPTGSLQTFRNNI